MKIRAFVCEREIYSGIEQESTRWPQKYIIFRVSVVECFDGAVLCNAVMCYG